MERFTSKVPFEITIPSSSNISVQTEKLEHSIETILGNKRKLVDGIDEKVIGARIPSYMLDIPVWLQIPNEITFFIKEGNIEHPYTIYGNLLKWKDQCSLERFRRNGAETWYIYLHRIRIVLAYLKIIKAWRHYCLFYRPSKLRKIRIVQQWWRDWYYRPNGKFAMKLYQQDFPS